ncbi:MAG: helix-turn-helix transcriptional regulator [Acinetobacter sp.]|nr:helix-turn-helix transcriptional regulator [Acinetobacter sp.]
MKENFRKLTLLELGLIIKIQREFRGWSQEQLAEISKLSVRTIQRVENAVSASFDTKRSLASAFDLKDLDYFNNPIDIPSLEKFEEEQKELEENFLKLDTIIIKTGKQFVELTVKSTGDYSSNYDEIPKDIINECANLIDTMRETRDIFEMYSELQKVEMYAEFDNLINSIFNFGISIVLAERKTFIKFENSDKAFPVKMVYINFFKKGSEPKQFLVPKEINCNF